MDSWLDHDWEGIVDAILGAARHTDLAGAARLPRAAAPEISRRWCHMPAVAALPPAHFASRLTLVPDGAVPEFHLCDVILSYIDRRQLPSEGNVAQRLLAFLDSSLFPRDYVQVNLSLVPPPSVRGLLPSRALTCKLFSPHVPSSPRICVS